MILIIYNHSISRLYKPTNISRGATNTDGIRSSPRGCNDASGTAAREPTWEPNGFRSAKIHGDFTGHGDFMGVSTVMGVPPVILHF